MRVMPSSRCPPHGTDTHGLIGTASASYTGGTPWSEAVGGRVSDLQL